MVLDIYYIERDEHPDHMFHLIEKDGDGYFAEILYKYDDNLRFPGEFVSIKELERFYDLSTKEQWDKWVRENAENRLNECASEITRYKNILGSLNNNE